MATVGKNTFFYFVRSFFYHHALYSEYQKPSVKSIFPWVPVSPTRLFLL